VAKPDLTINSIPLTPGQMGFVKKVLSHESRHVFYWTVSTSRQAGKTTLVTQLMTYYAVTDPGCHCMFTAPTYSLSKKQFKFILKGLDGTGLVKSSDASDYAIELTNGSTMSFKSVTLPDNLRGDSVSYLFCDEVALYKEEIFTTVLKPMLTVRGRKCFLFSTPRGRNWFFKMFGYGLDPGMYRYGSHTWNYEQNPYANLEEIEDARRTLPDDIFRQEYLAEFIDDSGSVFRHIADAQRVHKWANPGPRCFAGLDVGVTGDFMVLTIMDEKGSVLYVYRDTQKPIAELVAKVGDALRKYSPAVCLVEVNGVGQGLFDRFKREYSKCQEWVTTNDSKQDIISDLIMSFDDLEIAIPSRQLLPELSDELSLFGFEFSPKTRKITYKATTGHDDLVISLALADHARRRYANYGRYRVL
jgi:hypothetical protein